MTYIDPENLAYRVTAEASRQTWAYGIRLFAFSKGLIGFLFGIMLVPLQAGAAFGKSASAKPGVVRVLRKAPVKKGERPDLNFVTDLAHPAEELPESLIAEFRSSLIDYARTLLGRPYRSGGKKPASGFDCSGFTGYVFRQFGIALPSCSKSQSTVGVKVQKDSAQAGDLVFFGRRTRKGRTSIYHAGIVASNEGGRLRVIHSATGEGVVVTDMSRPGYWRNHLVSVRRVISRPAALVAAE